MNFSKQLKKVNSLFAQLIFLIIVTFPPLVCAQKATMREEKVSLNLPPRNPLLVQLNTYSIELSIKDSFILGYVEQRKDYLKVNGKQYVQHDSADFRIRLEVGGFELISDNLVKDINSDPTNYYNEIKFRLPAYLSVIHKTTTIYSESLFFKGEKITERSLDPGVLILRPNNIERFIDQAKMETMNEVLKEAQSELARFEPTIQQISISLGTVKSSKKEDYSSFDKALFAVFKGLKQLVKNEEKEKDFSLLTEPMNFWQEQLTELNWNEKDHRGAIVVCQYNLAVCNYWLGNLEKALEYLSSIKLGSGNGVGYFSSIYRPALEKEIFSKDSQLAQKAQESMSKKGLLWKLAELNAPQTVVTNMNQENESANDESQKLLKYDFNLDEWDDISAFDFEYNMKVDIPKFSNLNEVVQSALSKELINTSTSIDRLKHSLTIASLLKAIGDYQSALGHYYTSLDIALSQKDFNATYKAKVLLKVAQTEMSLSEYDVALEHLKLAQDLLDKTTNFTLQALLLDEYGKYYHTTGNYYEALDYFNRAMALKEKDSKENLYIAKSYELIGISYYQLESFDQSLNYLEKALKIKKKILQTNDARLSDTFVYLANTQNKLYNNRDDENQLGINYADSALDVRFSCIRNKDASLFVSDYPALDFNPTIFSEKDLKLDILNPIFGEQNHYLENPELSQKLDFYGQLIEETADIISPIHPSIGNYQKLVMLSNKQFYFAISAKWRKAGRGITGKIERIASQFKDVGKSKYDIELRVENFEFNEKYLDQVISSFESSIDQLDRAFGSNHPFLASQYTELAMLYQQVLPIYYEFINHFNDQLKNIEERMESLASTGTQSDNFIALKTKHQDLVDKFYYYADKTAFYEEQRITNYLESFQSNLNRQFVFSEDMSSFIESLEIRGPNSLLLSAEIFREALIAKSWYEIPYHESIMPPIFGEEVETFEEWMNYEDDVSRFGRERRNDLKIMHYRLNRLDDKDKRLGVMTHYDRYVDIMIQNLIHEEDKFALAGKTRFDRLAVIENTLGNWKKVKGEQRLNEAFYFTEKTKALTLLNSMQKVEAQHETNLPEGKTNQKKKLQEKIRSTKRKISFGVDDTYLDSLSMYKSELYELEKHFLDQFPKYAKSQYKNDVFSIKDIKGVLSENMALISYTFTGDNIFRITITKNKKPIYELIKLDEGELLRRIKGIRNSIIFQLEDSYLENAIILGKKLLPKLSDDIKKLIIIPDGELYTLPFEALLTEKIPKNDVGQYDKYPYLILDYDVSYSLSAATWLKYSLKKSYSDKKNFLAFAPVFLDKSELNEVSQNNGSVLKSFNQLDSTNTRGLLRNNKYVSPLPGTELEIGMIGKLFEDRDHESSLLLKTHAKESELKKEALSDFKYLHIATHGFVNTTHPSLSGLLLSQNEVHEDGILYSGEIYGLDIKSDLVTLSACETGLGKLVTGEGIVGITRGFLHAGAKNLIISYWKVSDQSTTELMVKFYQNFLDSGSSIYSHALKSAKIELILNSKYAHPYYWSPFVLIGN